MRNAIEEFRNKTLKVYQADPDRIIRDARSAASATGDHAGRWLFELLQNSEDAEAKMVTVLVKDNMIYVADTGLGLKPKAVSAICGTHLSDKSAGMIGRKGVGFKAVYEATQNPQVLTVKGEGIEFSPEKTKAWLRSNDLNDGHVPYQWIPFCIEWDTMRTADPQLEALENCKTVVRLPDLSGEIMRKMGNLLMEWPPHALFTFQHLRKITAPGFEVHLIDGDGAWLLSDSRKPIPLENWRVTKHTERPDRVLLEALAIDERNAIIEKGISFLIAAPMKNGCVVPTSDYLPIHVFYPTEQKGPVRLLLHAEFLVKSDRTALMPVDGNSLNAWVADRLAYYVCKFVNDSYCPEAPSSHATLLVPFAERASHPVAESVWRRIANEAKKCLRLADVEGCQRLSLEEAQLISVSVRTDLARTLLLATNVRVRLLYQAFDKNEEARKALRGLGCEEIQDKDLMATIAGNAKFLAADTHWVQACWEWLAAWVAKELDREKHRKRTEDARTLPIVPINGSLMKVSDLSGHIVTWKPDAGVYNLPDWLPLTFVEDWFRDLIQNEAEHESPVKKLSKELGITEPGADVIQSAVGRAIEMYWQDKQGDPGRFLHFIMEQDWHETSVASNTMQRCPVPLARPIQGDAWAEAGKAYFGREWHNDLLADLYEGCDDVAWVKNINGDAKRLHSILAWLGCATSPRIMKDHGPNNNGFVTNKLPDECREWGTREFRRTDRTPNVDPISHLNALTIRKLNNNQVSTLLPLLAKHWGDYYQGHSQATLSWFYYSKQSLVVSAFWWFQILHDIRPETISGSKESALADCWLPDKRTARAIGSLLPVVDIDKLRNDKDVLRNWLIGVVGLRTRIDRLSVAEWKGLLCTRIPEKAPAQQLVSDERLRDSVIKWYTACLETVAENENVPEKAFVSCPLLCRKGDVWQYVTDEPRYLDDDNSLGAPFTEDAWLFKITPRLAEDAVTYFGVPRLSQSVVADVTPGEPQESLADGLLTRLNESLPYVWAWRSSKSEQAADRLSVRLKGLKVLVVPDLKASLSLNGVRHEVERSWHENDFTIYLHKDHANEAKLAQALAKALGVRSENDFCQILLLCTDNHQRREQLLNKGIADAEIDRCLREYSGPSVEEEHNEAPGKPTGDKQNDRTCQQPSGGGSQVQQREKSPVTPPSEASGGPPSVSQESGKQPFRLKDPSTAEYSFNSLLGQGAGTGRSSEGGGTRQEGPSLTDAGKAESGEPDRPATERELDSVEKKELEEKGRKFAIHALEREGYSVEPKEPDNPGYDLLAKKDGDELRVEVKAHKGGTAYVDLTHREYTEYRNQQGYRWELWNVEHLAEQDRKSVRITPYDGIPEEACQVQAYRVNLRKCSRSDRLNK